MIEFAIGIGVGIVFGGGTVLLLVMPARVKFNAVERDMTALRAEVRRQFDEEGAVLRRRHDETQQEIGALWKEIRDIEAAQQQQQGGEMARIAEMLQGVAGADRRRNPNHPPVGSDT